MGVLRLTAFFNFCGFRHCVGIGEVEALGDFFCYFFTLERALRLRDGETSGRLEVGRCCCRSSFLVRTQGDEIHGFEPLRWR